MPVNYELTQQFMGIVLLILAIFIFLIFRNQSKEKNKYYHFSEAERESLIYLMSISLRRQTPLEEWKDYLHIVGVPEEQFNELLNEVQEKILNP